MTDKDMYLEGGKLFFYVLILIITFPAYIIIGFFFKVVRVKMKRISNILGYRLDSLTKTIEEKENELKSKK